MLTADFSPLFSRPNMLRKNNRAVIRPRAPLGGESWENMTMRKFTRTAAFQFYNTKPRNPFWSWSARSKHELVVTLWKHEFQGPAGNMVYSKNNLQDWHTGTGSRAFIQDLAWALTHCGGLVRVIVVVRDESALPAIRASECYPCKNLVMRVTHLDPATGAFSLEQVAPATVTPPARAA